MAFPKNVWFSICIALKKLLPAHRPTQWDLLAKTLGVEFLLPENKTGHSNGKNSNLFKCTLPSLLFKKVQWMKKVEIETKNIKILKFGVRNDNSFNFKMNLNMQNDYHVLRKLTALISFYLTAASDLIMHAHSITTVGLYIKE